MNRSSFIQLFRLRWQLFGGAPVLVYQMGKVGSSSVMRSLVSHGVRPVFHVHRLNPVHREKLRKDGITESRAYELEAVEIYRHVIQQQRPAKIISLVREPVGRNVSAFFQNLDALSGQTRAGALRAPDKLKALFLDAYPHAVPLKWFDVEMQQTLGIDVYAQPFPKEQGHTVLRRGPFEVLILRAELPDPAKAGAIQHFLGVDAFDIRRENVTANKDYASVYESFKEDLVLPAAYLDMMYGAHYTRHFYTPEEIGRMRSRWSASKQRKR